MKKGAISKDDFKHKINQTVCGVCYKYSNLRKYILWALRLLEDMPLIFNSVKFLTAGQVPKKEIFDVYIVDDLESHKAATADLVDAPKPNGGTITIVLKSKSCNELILQTWSVIAKKFKQ